ncbi:MAG: hypothetical protein HOP07_01200 [Bacteriovoracaceae bacterium]|nr:hypothetical protein [Bacteriovoracaceae bacterium]
MKEKAKIFFTLFLIGSCALDSMKNKTHNAPDLNDDWAMIEKIESEKWSREKVVSFLGEPHKVMSDKKDKFEALFYNYPRTNHQQWSFEFSKENALLNITFVPTTINREDFTISSITQKWGVICTKKKEVDTSMHFIRNIYYLDCGKNHRAYLNRYDEVTSLTIDFL